MKHLVIFSILTATVLPALSAKRALTGSCTVMTATAQEKYDFSAAPDQKFKLGISEEVAPQSFKQFKVSVVNNIGNKESAANWGHRVLIAVSVLEREFANPPVLCPTTPLDARNKCLRENELSGSNGTSFDRFSERYNDGYVDHDATVFALKSLKNGTVLNTNTIKLTANTSLKCKAVFRN